MVVEGFTVMDVRNLTFGVLVFVLYGYDVVDIIKL